MEEWDEALVKHISACVIANQKTVDGELQTLRDFHEQHAHITEQRLEAMQDQVETVTTMLPSRETPVLQHASLPDSVTSMWNRNQPKDDTMKTDPQSCKMMSQTTLVPTQAGIANV